MNKTSEYILNKMKERRQDDNLYQLAKRTNIPDGTLRNMFKAENAWVQAIYLMRICADLGISMESAILCEEVEYDKDADINYWKEKFFEADNDNKNLKEENGKLRAANRNLL